MKNFVLKNFNIISLSGFLVLGVFVSGVIVFADTASTAVTVGNAAPVISSLSFNGGADFTSTENTFKWASTTMTVTDSNGCDTITEVTTKLYLASTSNLGTLCTYNGNNCYTSHTCAATTTGNTCTGGADTSAQYDCGFQIWYPATPTDSGTWASSIWSVSATTTDGTDTGTATNTAETIEVITLNALNVTSSINYGSVSANSNTGTTDQETVVTNTGNIAQDTELSGTDMCLSGVCANGYFGADQQKYDLIGPGTDYSALTYTLPATTSSAASLATVLVKPTATTSAVTDSVYWGLAVPSGQTSGSYTGTDTFSAITDTND